MDDYQEADACVKAAVSAAAGVALDVNDDSQVARMRRQDASAALPRVDPESTVPSMPRRHEPDGSTAATTPTAKEPCAAPDAHAFANKVNPSVEDGKTVGVECSDKRESGHLPSEPLASQVLLKINLTLKNTD